MYKYYTCHPTWRSMLASTTVSAMIKVRPLLCYRNSFGQQSRSSFLMRTLYNLKSHKRSTIYHKRISWYSADFTRHENDICCCLTECINWWYINPAMHCTDISKSCDLMPFVMMMYGICITRTHYSLNFAIQFCKSCGCVELDPVLKSRYAI